MAKLIDNITNLLAAVGTKLTDEQKATLAELPGDEVSTTVQGFFDTITNSASGEFAKLAQKAGNLDKFDESLAGWADILGDDIKTTAKEKGIQKLDKVKALIASTIEKAKAAAASGDNVDAEKLRAKIIELEQQAAKLVADKDKEIADVRAESSNQLFNYKMLTKLQGRTDILDAYKKEGALKKLVLPEILEYLKEKGLEVRPEQLDVVMAELKTPYQKGGKAVTVDEIFEEALDARGYRQNAGPTPPRSVVSVDGGGNSKMTKMDALRPTTVATSEV